MRGFIKFNKSVFKMPIGWQLWLLVLVAHNMVAPLLFVGRLEAQLTLGAFVGSGILFSVMTARFGFTRILGLGHILWIPLVVFLATRLGVHPADDFFGIWLRSLIALNSISLVIDAVDVIRYVRGNRAETVKVY